MNEISIKIFLKRRISISMGIYLLILIFKLGVRFLERERLMNCFDAYRLILYGFGKFSKNVEL